MTPSKAIRISSGSLDSDRQFKSIKSVWRNLTVLAFYLRELTYNQAREANWADSGSRAADVGDDMASAGLPLRSSSVRCGRHIERHGSAPGLVDS